MVGYSFSLHIWNGYIGRIHKADEVRPLHGQMGALANLTSYEQSRVDRGIRTIQKVTGVASGQQRQRHGLKWVQVYFLLGMGPQNFRSKHRNHFFCPPNLLLVERLLNGKTEKDPRLLIHFRRYPRRHRVVDGL